MTVAAGRRWDGVLAFWKVPRGKGTVVLGYKPRGEGERTIRSTLEEIAARWPAGAGPPGSRPPARLTRSPPRAPR